jgi:transposase InsO family protein
MTNDDVIYRHRLRILALAAECGSVAGACRIAGINRSTFYRWRNMAQRFGLEILRPRERRAPQMPNATPVLIEQRILAFSLGQPGLGPRRIAAELARPNWGGFVVSAASLWRVLARHGLSTRSKRLALIAGYAAPPEPSRPEPQPERHLEADRPGELVQFDSFCIGRLSGTKGIVWQYTAIDAASSYVWAELHVTPRHPDVRFCSALARRVAKELVACGWRLERVTTDNGSEVRNHVFDETAGRLGARHTLLYPGRPQSNGCVERVQRTILEECWKPAFARFLIPKYVGLRSDPERYLRYYG